MGTKVIYLYHSGFAVKTSGHFLIFDYWRDTPKNGGLRQGVIDPLARRGDDVVVFASHNHDDHYNRVILDWKRDIPKLRIVLSDDIPAADGAFMVGPGETLNQPDFTVQTLKSNDEGVAFIVDIDGLRIYHGGDLNWWHWEGEPADWNDEVADSYKTEIAKLYGKPVDLAFIPVDPRLEDQYAWGIDYIMRRLDAHHAVPMHFADDPSVVKRLLSDPVTEGYRDRIIGLTERGQSAEI